MIYLDHNATTPPRPEVIEACARSMHEHFANPSSVHQLGQAARAALERARRQVAALIGASARDLIWTSGATEANALALHGALAPALRAGQAVTVITSAGEHPSVQGNAAALVEAGARWRALPLDAEGQPRLDVLAALLEEHAGERVLVSLLRAHNELGDLYPVAEAAALCAARGALLHCDATQAVGRVPVDVGALGVDLLSLSGHKMGGPRGIGALYARRGVALAPLARGGHQERGRRAGTEDVAAAVGLGAACAWAADEGLARWAGHVAPLGARLGEGLLAAIDGAQWLGRRALSTGNTCCVTFAGAPADELLMALDLAGVAVSAGSACASGSLEPSPVLLAMGLDPTRARQTVRLSVGQTTTAEEVEAALAIIAAQVAHVRGVHR